MAFQQKRALDTVMHKGMGLMWTYDTTFKVLGFIVSDAAVGLLLSSRYPVS